jgi:hypothetical protein
MQFRFKSKKVNIMKLLHAILGLFFCFSLLALAGCDGGVDELREEVPDEYERSEKHDDPYGTDSGTYDIILDTPNPFIEDSTIGKIFDTAGLRHTEYDIGSDMIISLKESDDLGDDVKDIADQLNSGSDGFVFDPIDFGIFENVLDVLAEFPASAEAGELTIGVNYEDVDAEPREDEISGNVGAETDAATLPGLLLRSSNPSFVPILGPLEDDGSFNAVGKGQTSRGECMVTFEGNWVFYLDENNEKVYQLDGIYTMCTNLENPSAYSLTTAPQDPNALPAAPDSEDFADEDSVDNADSTVTQTDSGRVDYGDPGLDIPIKGFG